MNPLSLQEPTASLPAAKKTLSSFSTLNTDPQFTAVENMKQTRPLQHTASTTYHVMQNTVQTKPYTDFKSKSLREKSATSGYAVHASALLIIPMKDIK